MLLPQVERCFEAGAVATGCEVTVDRSGSTDMANVSLAMPAIHPMLRIASGGAVNHQPEFAAACVTADADRAVRDGALAMARTGVAITESRPVRERLLGRAFRADA